MDAEEGKPMGEAGRRAGEEARKNERAAPAEPDAFGPHAPAQEDGSSVGPAPPSAAARPKLEEVYQRRVPGVLGGFAGFAGLALAAGQVLVEHKPISPRLLDILLVLLALLLPYAALLAFSPALPPSRAWRAVRRFGLPLWSLAGVVLIGALLQAQPLWMLETLRGEDPDGNPVEREVPRPQYRRSVALFPFENEAEEEALKQETDWLRLGIVWGSVLDLGQNPFLHIAVPSAYAFRSVGYPDGSGVPPPLQREMARKRHCRFVLTGSYLLAGDTLSITATLHDVDRSRTRTTDRIVVPLLSAIDSLSVVLNRMLDFQSWQQGRYADRPLTELLTDSRAALQAMVEGRYEQHFSQDHYAARLALEDAVRADSTSAYAHLLLSELLDDEGRFVAAEGVLRKAMEHDYRLPGPMRYAIRARWHGLRFDLSAAQEALEALIQIYPEFVPGYLSLASLLRRQGDTQGALAVLERVLLIAPDRLQEWKTIASLYEDRGEWELALEALETYHGHFPDDASVHVRMGDVHMGRGAYEEARAAYERARALEPDWSSTLLDLARSEMALGNFEQGWHRLEEAEQYADLHDRYAAVYGAMAEYCATRGEIANVNRYVERWRSHLGSGGNVLAESGSALTIMGVFAQAGMIDSALVVWSTLDADLEVVEGWLGQFIRAVARGVLYFESDSIEEAVARADLEQGIAELEAVLAEITPQLGMPVPAEHLMRGRFAEIDQRWSAAREWYAAALERSHDATLDAMLHERIGICHDREGDPRAARDAYLRALEFDPIDPLCRCRLADVYQELGDERRMAEQLEAALQTWETADPDFAPARVAREKLAALREQAS